MSQLERRKIWIFKNGYNILEQYVRKRGGNLKMNYLKKFYGKTVLDNSDSDEIRKDFKIELEYYQIEDETFNKPYGIEIVKKDTEENENHVENKIVDSICCDKQDVDALLEILVRNKVTPIIAEEIVEDWLIGDRSQVGQLDLLRDRCESKWE